MWFFKELFIRKNYAISFLLEFFRGAWNFENWVWVISVVGWTRVLCGE
jgi:hypothetical protein